MDLILPRSIDGYHRCAELSTELQAVEKSCWYALNEDLSADPQDFSGLHKMSGAVEWHTLHASFSFALPSPTAFTALIALDEAMLSQMLSYANAKWFAELIKDVRVMIPYIDIFSFKTLAPVRKQANIWEEKSVKRLTHTEQTFSREKDTAGTAYYGWAVDIKQYNISADSEFVLPLSEAPASHGDFSFHPSLPVVVVVGHF